MPFWKKDKEGGGGGGGGSGGGKENKPKEKVNYKARLEHKQYLAQESPEPVYDLMECGLKQLPSGVFSRCKVGRKQALLLSDNELVSLGGGGNLRDLAELAILDLHNNSLDKLPEEIGQLSKLTTLYLQNNKLKQIPSTIGDLKNLKTLNLSGNCIKDLPVSISGLTNLSNLDLRNNSKLKRIPKDLCRCRCLDTLLLDEEHIVYPAPEVVSGGTEAIMRFLCKECDIEYLPPSQCLPLASHTNGEALIRKDPFQDIVSDHLAKAEKIKEEKRKNAMLLEQQLLEAQEKEAKLKMQSLEEKKKLLDDIAQEESKKSEEVMKIQKLKEEERSRLFSKMTNAEKQSDLLISELMTASSRYSDPKKVMEALEAERREMEANFTIQQKDVEKLKEKEVLRAMQMMMEEELQREATRRQYEQRQGIVQSAINSTLENDKAVETVLASKGKQQDELIGKLLEDEKYQREAFQSLLLKQDQRSQEISDQMSLIQNELGSLTLLEMQKRDLKVEFELEMLKDKRDTLTKMLLDLIEKKKQRAEDLQDLLGDLEKGRSEQQENYWLIQYQKLLDSKPEGVKLAESTMDPQVKKLLGKIGGDKLVPIFAKKNITFKQLYCADNRMLKEWGVESEYMRSQILLAAEGMIEKEGRRGVHEPTAPADDTEPSAPSEEEEGGAPSAPSLSVIETFNSAECVVCMERKCDMIFLPCGHMCSCSVCEQSVQECPLCRSPVLQRVRLR